MTVIHADGRRYEIADGTYSVEELVAMLNEQHPGTVEEREGKIFFPRMAIRLDRVFAKGFIEKAGEKS